MLANALFNYEDINKKKTLNITHFLLREQPYSIWTVKQDFIKLGRFNIYNLSLYQVSTNSRDEADFPLWKKAIKVW